MPTQTTSETPPADKPKQSNKPDVPKVKKEPKIDLIVSIMLTILGSVLVYVGGGWRGLGIVMFAVALLPFAFKVLFRRR